jgi:glycogen debranching enzyme, archaeal type, putative
MIQFDKETCGNLEAAAEREWLETNGLGGYASSTIAGLNTRRYHGLLVAATRPPVGRLVMLSKLEETLIIGARRYELSTNQYPGAVHPHGYQLQTGFRLDPFPIFTYQIAGITLEKSVFMIQGENSVAIEYKIKIDEDDAAKSQLPLADCFLELHPLIAARDYHSLAHENAALNSEIKIDKASVACRPYEDAPEIYFAHEADAFEKSGHWYRSFEYKAERERGFDFTEDLYNPFILKFDLSKRERVCVIASTESREIKNFDDYKSREIARRRQVVSAAPSDDEFICALTLAADQFIVARGEQKTVIAGYHWFSDWGRDTMIALPGLTLVTGRAEIARSILLEFARHVDRGMLPNRFPDAGAEPEYNTVDATLWFFEAVRALLDYTNDYEFVRDKLYEILTGIIDWHVRGTRYNIHVDEDGLLASGAEGAQLTWMDAKVNDWVVTPRRGKPVEIQALWYNVLRVMEHLAQRFSDAEREKFYSELSARAHASFNQKFWNEERGCLFDVIDGESRDASIRPNQIFAVSLTHNLLSAERAQSVVETVERELLTPYGLRSLARTDKEYRGRYEGSPLSRDGAYHQGTVWAWLIGPYITAYLKVFSSGARDRAAAMLAPFRKHLCEAGLGQVSEIFDGDEPHTPRGCIAQAWSVAEILRAAVEDVYTPRHATNLHHTKRRAGGAENSGAA